MIAKTLANSTRYLNTITLHTPLISKFFQAPAPNFPWFISNLRSIKHTLCHYFTLSKPGNPHLSQIAASHYPKRVLRNCDMVIWHESLVTNSWKKVQSCSLTTIACNNDNVINELMNTLFTQRLDMKKTSQN